MAANIALHSDVCAIDHAVSCTRAVRTHSNCAITQKQQTENRHLLKRLRHDVLIVNTRSSRSRQLPDLL